MQKLFFQVLLITTCLIFSLQGLAQQSFNIDKRGKVKRVKYYIGQDINLRYNNTKLYGQITALNDSSITVEGVNIPISTINYVVHLRQAFIWVFIRKVGYRAGIGYFMLDAGNRLINNESPAVDAHTLNVSLPLIGLGVVGSLMKNKRFKNKGYNMRVNDLSIKN